MADSQSKIDAAAEKAFAEAAEKKTADAVSAKKAVLAVETAVPARTEALAETVAAKPAKPARKKARAEKPVARKTTARKAAPAKQPAAAKPAKAAREKAAPAGTNPISQLKDTIMATAKKSATTDYTAKAKELAADVQTRAKAAYDKGTEMTKDAVEFQKGNLEALVASGKILATGMQDMGRAYVEEAKSAAETVQDDVKKLTAVKSPTELFQLQGELARRNFDALVATTSKNAETMLKLANDAFAPVSSRMSLAAAKFGKAA